MALEFDCEHAELRGQLLASDVAAPFRGHRRNVSGDDAMRVAAAPDAHRIKASAAEAAFDATRGTSL